MKESVLKTKSYQFALEIISTYKELTLKKEYILSKQLLRSGTSIGANIREGLFLALSEGGCHQPPGATGARAGGSLRSTFAASCGGRLSSTVGSCYRQSSKA